jgi:hypothetical protein
MKNLIVVLFFISATVFAQERNHEKIQAFKVAYITEKLNLTSAEAEKFWPLYNAYDEKRRDLRKQEKRVVFNKLKDGFETMSDAEANKLLDEYLDIKTKELELTRALVQDLKATISPKKIIILRKTEEEFKRKLLERIKQRRNNR